MAERFTKAQKQLLDDVRSETFGTMLECSSHIDGPQLLMLADQAVEAVTAMKG